MSLFDADKYQELKHIHTGYAGPGLWVVIASHFGPRLPEWTGSLSMFLLGVVCLANPDLFTLSETYTYFRAVFGSQVLLGVILFVFGFIGLLALTVNGLRKEVTPLLRTIRAIAGFLVFTGMSTCFALTGILGFWIAFFPVVAFAELINMFSTSREAGHATNGPNR